MSAHVYTLTSSAAAAHEKEMIRQVLFNHLWWKQWRATEISGEMEKVKNMGP